MEGTDLNGFWKRKDGILSIEAAIALTSFMFLIMFLIDIGRVYQAQNYVTHGLLQTSKSIAAASYKTNRDVQYGFLMGSVNGFLEGLLSGGTVDNSSYNAAWERKDMEELVEMIYGTCVAGSDSAADAALKKCGLSNGRGSINFQGTCLENGDKDILIKASYTVELPFKVFGYQQVTLRQNVRSRLWKAWED